MAISESPRHVGQCRAMRALTAPLFQHPFVLCQGREDVHVPRASSSVMDCLGKIQADGYSSYI
eukprot:8287828-Pyramimonas_sp.AAC.3